MKINCEDAYEICNTQNWVSTYQILGPFSLTSIRERTKVKWGFPETLVSAVWHPPLSHASSAPTSLPEGLLHI